MANNKTRISSSIANTSKSAFKMIGEATRDVLEEAMPNLSSIMSGTASESSALLNNMISKSKNLFSKQSSMMDGTTLGRQIKNNQSKVFDRLSASSGMYNNLADEVGILGNSFNEDTFDEGADGKETFADGLGAGRENLQALSSVNNTIAQSSAMTIKGLGHMTNTLANVQMETTKGLADTFKNIGIVQTNANMSGLAAVTKQLEISNQYNAAMLEFMNKNVSPSNANMTDYFAVIGQKLDVIAEALSSKSISPSIEQSRTDMDKILSNGIGMDMSQYKKHIATNIKSSGLGQALQLAKGFTSGFGGGVAGIASSGLSMIVPQLIKQTVNGILGENRVAFEKMDSDLFNIIRHNLYQLGDKANFGSNRFESFIGKIFGIQRPTLSKINLSKGRKDETLGWNGVAQTALTQVIPNYLASIERALTNSKEKKMYDYGSGTFMSESEAMSSLLEKIVAENNNAFEKATTNIIDSLAKNGGASAKTINELIDKINILADERIKGKRTFDDDYKKEVGVALANAGLHGSDINSVMIDLENAIEQMTMGLSNIYNRISGDATDSIIYRGLFNRLDKNSDLLEAFDKISNQYINKKNYNVLLGMPDEYDPDDFWSRFATGSAKAVFQDDYAYISDATSQIAKFTAAMTDIASHQLMKGGNAVKYAREEQKASSRKSKSDDSSSSGLKGFFNRLNTNPNNVNPDNDNTVRNINKNVYEGLISGEPTNVLQSLAMSIHTNMLVPMYSNVFSKKGMLYKFFGDDPNSEFNKLKERLFGKENGIFTPMADWIKYQFTGKGYTARNGKVYEDTDDNIGNALKKVYGKAFDGSMQYLFGEDYEKSDGYELFRVLSPESFKRRKAAKDKYKRMLKIESKFRGRITDATRRFTEGETNLNQYDKEIDSIWDDPIWEDEELRSYGDGDGYNALIDRIQDAIRKNDAYLADQGFIKKARRQKPIGMGKNQHNPVWANYPTGIRNGHISTMQDSGCGPMALAYISSMYGNDVDPRDIVDYAISNGYISDGGATAELFTKGASRLGLNGKRIGLRSAINNLREGIPAIFAGKNSKRGSIYSKQGHIVSAIGIQGNNIVILDPETGIPSIIPIKDLEGTTDSFSFKKPIGFGDSDISAQTTTPPVKGYTLLHDLYQKIESIRSDLVDISISLLPKGRNNTLGDEVSDLRIGMLEIIKQGDERNIFLKKLLDNLGIDTAFYNKNSQSALQNNITPNNTTSNIIYNIGNSDDINASLTTINDTLLKISELVVNTSATRVMSGRPEVVVDIVDSYRSANEKSITDDRSAEIIKRMDESYKVNVGDYLQSAAKTGLIVESDIQSILYANNWSDNDRVHIEDVVKAISVMVNTKINRAFYSDVEDIDSADDREIDIKDYFNQLKSDGNDLGKEVKHAISDTHDRKKGKISVKESIRVASDRINEEIIKFTNKFKDNSENLKDAVFGNAKNYKNLFKGKVSELNEKLSNLPKTLFKGGLLGATVGTLNAMGGGFLPSLFLPGGPVAGAVVGLGLSIASKSDKFMNTVFGEKDDNGKRQGGILSKKLQSSFMRALPMAVGGATVGTIKSLIGAAVGLPTGGILTGSLLGTGPVGAAIIGLGLGIIKHNETLRQKLFGEKSESDNKLYGGMLSKQLNKATDAVVAGKDFIIKGLKGAGFGALTGATIANMGILGGSLAIGGPIGAAIAGLGIGIASNTERFQEYLFGTKYKDVDGKDKIAKNGFFDRSMNMLNDKLFIPVRDRFQNRLEEFGVWANKNITVPFKLAFGPIIDDFSAFKEELTTTVRNAFEKVATKVTDVFRNGIERIINPIAGLSRKMLNFGIDATKLQAQLVGTAISLPLRFLAMTQIRRRAKNEEGYRSMLMDEINTKRKAENADIMNSEYYNQHKIRRTGKLLYNNTIGAAADLFGITGVRSTKLGALLKEAYGSGMRKQGKNSLGYMEASEQSKVAEEELKVRQKKRKEFSKVQKTLSQWKKEDRYNEALDWNSETFDKRRKYLIDHGIISNAVNTQSGIKELMYHISDWRDKYGEFGEEDKEAKKAAEAVVEAQEQEKKDTSEFRQSVLNKIDTLINTLTGAGEKTGAENNIQNLSETAEKYQEELIKNGLSPEDVTRLDDTTPLKFDNEKVVDAIFTASHIKYENNSTVDADKALDDLVRMGTLSADDANKIKYRIKNDDVAVDSISKEDLRNVINDALNENRTAEHEYAEEQAEKAEESAESRAAESGTHREKQDGLWNKLTHKKDGTLNIAGKASQKLSESWIGNLFKSGAGVFKFVKDSPLAQVALMAGAYYFREPLLQLTKTVGTFAKNTITEYIPAFKDFLIEDALPFIYSSMGDIAEFAIKGSVELAKGTYKGLKQLGSDFLEWAGWKDNSEFVDTIDANGLTADGRKAAKWKNPETGQYEYIMTKDGKYRVLGDRQYITEDGEIQSISRGIGTDLLRIGFNSLKNKKTASATLKLFGGSTKLVSGIGKWIPVANNAFRVTDKIGDIMLAGAKGIDKSDTATSVLSALQQSALAKQSKLNKSIYENALNKQVKEYTKWGSTLLKDGIDPSVIKHTVLESAQENFGKTVKSAYTAGLDDVMISNLKQAASESLSNSLDGKLAKSTSSLCDKVFSWMSKGMRNSRNLLTSVFSGTIVEKIFGLFDKLFASFKKLGSRAVGMFASEAGAKMAEGAVKTLTVVGWALTAYDVYSGFTNADTLFGVPEDSVDGTMRNVSTVMNTLLGLGIGPVLDLFFTIYGSVSGRNIRREIAINIYTTIMEVRGKESKISDLKNAQAIMEAELALYNSDHEGGELTMDEYLDLKKEKDSFWNKVKSALGMKSAVTEDFSKYETGAKEGMTSTTSNIKSYDEMIRERLESNSMTHINIVTTNTSNDNIGITDINTSTPVGKSDNDIITSDKFTTYGSYSQKDPRWSQIAMDIAGNLVGAVGCGPIALASLAKKYFIDVDPNDVIEITKDNHLGINGGSDPSLFTEGASVIGLNGTRIPLSEIESELNDGKKLIVAGKLDENGNGHPYTSDGHALVVEKTGDNTVITDPTDGYSYNANLDNLLKYTKDAWSFDLDLNEDLSNLSSLTSEDISSIISDKTGLDPSLVGKTMGAFGLNFDYTTSGGSILGLHAENATPIDEDAVYINNATVYINGSNVYGLQGGGGIGGISPLLLLGLGGAGVGALALSNGMVSGIDTNKIILENLFSVMRTAGFTDTEIMEYAGFNPNNLDSATSETMSEAINNIYNNKDMIIDDAKSNAVSNINDKKTDITQQITDAIEQVKSDMIDKIMNSDIVTTATNAIEDLDKTLMMAYHYPYEGGINYLINNPASVSRFILGAAGMLIGNGLTMVPEIFNEYGRWLGLSHYEHSYDGDFNENILTYEKNGMTRFYKDPTGLTVREANPGSALEFITDDNGRARLRTTYEYGSEYIPYYTDADGNVQYLTDRSGKYRTLDDYQYLTEDGEIKSIARNNDTYGRLLYNSIINPNVGSVTMRMVGRATKTISGIGSKIPGIGIPFKIVNQAGNILSNTGRIIRDKIKDGTINKEPTAVIDVLADAIGAGSKNKNENLFKSKLNDYIKKGIQDGTISEEGIRATATNLSTKYGVPLTEQLSREIITENIDEVSFKSKSGKSPKKTKKKTYRKTKELVSANTEFGDYVDDAIKNASNGKLTGSTTSFSTKMGEVIKDKAKNILKTMLDGLKSGLESVRKKFGGKVIDTVIDFFDKYVVKFIKSLNDKFAQYFVSEAGKCMVSTVAKTAIPIIDVVTKAVDLAVGWANTESLFGVPEGYADTGMKLVSSLMNFILGLGYGPIVDLIFTIYQSLTGENLKRTLAVAIYEVAMNIITKGNGAEKAAELKNLQKTTYLELEKYNAEHENSPLNLEEYLALKEESNTAWNKIKNIFGKGVTEDFSKYHLTVKEINDANGIPMPSMSASPTPIPTQYSSATIVPSTAATYVPSMSASPTPTTEIKLTINNNIGSETSTAKDSTYSLTQNGDSMVVNNNFEDGNMNTLSSSGSVGYGNTFSQADPRWGKYKLGKLPNGKDATMDVAGCGPTALANVANSLGVNANPLQIAKMAKSNGYISDGGANSRLFDIGAKKLGLRSNRITPSQIMNRLKSGEKVILAGRSNSRNSIFSPQGHIVTATGYGVNDNILLEDSMGNSDIMSINDLITTVYDSWAISNKTESNDIIIEADVDSNRRGTIRGWLDNLKDYVIDKVGNFVLNKVSAKVSMRKLDNSTGLTASNILDVLKLEALERIGSVVKKVLLSIINKIDKFFIKGAKILTNVSLSLKSTSKFKGMMKTFVNMVAKCIDFVTSDKNIASRFWKALVKKLPSIAALSIGKFLSRIVSTVVSVKSFIEGFKKAEMFGVPEDQINNRMRIIAATLNLLLSLDPVGPWVSVLFEIVKGITGFDPLQISAIKVYNESFNVELVNDLVHILDNVLDSADESKARLDYHSISGKTATFYGHPFSEAGHILTADKVFGDKIRISDPQYGSHGLYSYNDLAPYMTDAWSVNNRAIGYGSDLRYSAGENRDQAVWFSPDMVSSNEIGKLTSSNYEVDYLFAKSQEYKLQNGKDPNNKWTSYWSSIYDTYNRLTSGTISGENYHNMQSSDQILNALATVGAMPDGITNEYTISQIVDSYWSGLSDSEIDTLIQAYKSSLYYPNNEYFSPNARNILNIVNRKNDTHESREQEMAVRLLLEFKYILPMLKMLEGEQSALFYAKMHGYKNLDEIVEYSNNDISEVVANTISDEISNKYVVTDEGIKSAYKMLEDGGWDKPESYSDLSYGEILKLYDKYPDKALSSWLFRYVYNIVDFMMHDFDSLNYQDAIALSMRKVSDVYSSDSETGETLSLLDYALSASELYRNLSMHKNRYESTPNTTYGIVNSLPFFNPADSAWSSKSWRGASVGTKGSDIASLASILTAYSMSSGSGKIIDPTYLFDNIFTTNNRSLYGPGGFANKLFTKYGLQSVQDLFNHDGIPMTIKAVSSNEDLANSLSSGQLVMMKGSDRNPMSIFGNYPSPETAGGHYVVATNTDEFGNIVIADPYNHQPLIFPLSSLFKSMHSSIAFADGDGNGVSGIGQTVLSSTSTEPEEAKSIWDTIVEGASGVLGTLSAFFSGMSSIIENSIYASMSNTEYKSIFEKEVGEAEETTSETTDLSYLDSLSNVNNSFSITSIPSSVKNKYRTYASIINKLRTSATEQSMKSTSSIYDDVTKANTAQKHSNDSSITKAQKLNVEWNKIVSDDGNIVIYGPIFKRGYDWYDYENDVKKFGHDTMNEVAESYFKSKEPGRGSGGRSGIGSRSVGYGIGGEDDEYDIGTIGGVFSAVASKYNEALKPLLGLATLDKSISDESNEDSTNNSNSSFYNNSGEPTWGNGKSAKGLITFAKSLMSLGCRYVWGGSCKKLTSSYKKSLRATFASSNSQYNDTYYQEKYELFPNRYVSDCSGIMRGYTKTSTNAHGYYTSCTQSGRTTNMPNDILKTPGILLFRANNKGTMVHIGYNIGDGNVIDTGGYISNASSDVKIRKFSTSNWTHWGKSKYLDYGIAANSSNLPADFEPVALGYGNAVNFLTDTLGGIVTQGVGSIYEPNTGIIRRHRGTDIAAIVNTPIKSPVSGKVVESKSVGYGSDYGNYVVVQDSHGARHLLGHMNNKSTYGIGAKVNTGDILGYVGSTGRSTGPHVHYEVREKGHIVDPLSNNRYSDISVMESKLDEAMTRYGSSVGGADDIAIIGDTLAYNAESSDTMYRMVDVLENIYELISRWSGTDNELQNSILESIENAKETIQSNTVNAINTVSNNGSNAATQSTVADALSVGGRTLHSIIAKKYR